MPRAARGAARRAKVVLEAQAFITSGRRGNRRGEGKKENKRIRNYSLKMERKPIRTRPQIKGLNFTSRLKALN
jgi:hypothetical protein